MKKIYAGIVGFGFIGPIHLEALRRLGFVETAICRGNKDLVAKAAEEYGIEKYYSDWREMVADPEIDVIHVCAPNNLHYPVAMAAMEAGKHVICDKPLSMSAKECEDMVKKAKETGVVNAVTFNKSMYPMINEAKEIIARGEIGKINYIQGFYLQDWLLYDTDYSWRIEASLQGESRVVSDIGTHCLHAITKIIGADITRVFADTNTFVKTRKKPNGSVATFAKNTGGDTKDIEVDTDDQATVLLRFSNGAKGVFIGGQIFAGRKNKVGFEIYGTNGTLAWNGEEPDKLWIGRRDGANRELVKDASLVSENVAGLVQFSGGLIEGYGDTWKNLMKNIYSDIVSGSRDGNYPKFEEGLKMARVVEATVESAKKDCWIDIQ